MQTLSNDWLMRGNAYAFTVAAHDGDIDNYARKLGITASTTLEQLCSIVTSQLTGEKSATVIINTNDVMLSSTAPQFLRDICALFGYDSCPQAHFEINILDNGTPIKLEIRYSDKLLKNISIIRVVDGVVSKTNSFALSDSTIKVIGKGSIESNTSYTFTCVNNHIYRMTIQAIGTNAGSVVVFGKHPSVNDVKYSNYPSGNPQDPTISVSGSDLTVTAAASAKVFYVIEDIYTP